MSLIKSTIDKGVMTITLANPDKLNSFNRQMAFQLQEALDDASNNKQVRCIVITGEGRAFCAGQDLAEAINEDNGLSIKKIVNEHYNPIIKKITEIKKPVVAAVNGVAAGAGANIALACDMVLASKSAKFIQAFSAIGLIPDSGGTYFLPRLVGSARAMGLMMSGDRVSADEAVAIGMIYKSIDDDKFSEEVEQAAIKLAQMPTMALALTKELVQKTWYNDLAKQLRMEEDFQDQCGSSHDYKEGVAAFMEKRKPNFKGE